MNDQDEFQFRPLTEGLGFHRKSSETSNETSFKINSNKKFSPAQETTTLLPRKGMGMKANFSLDPSSEPIRKSRRDLNRENALEREQTNNTVDEILKTLSQKKNLEIVDKKKFLNETPPLQFVPSSFDIAAGLLDGMLITASTLLCLILLLVITRIDLFANLTHPDSQGVLYLSLLTLVSGITWVYLVGNRIVLGFTPGEWVFDQRLGTPEELETVAYTVKIVARTTAVIATGFFLIPLFSFLFRSDLLGKALGIELMKQSRG